MTIQSEVKSLAQFYRENEDIAKVSYRQFTNLVKKDTFSTLEECLEGKTKSDIKVEATDVETDPYKEDDDFFEEVVEENNELKI